MPFLVDASFCRSSPIARGVLHRTLGQELEERASRARDGRPDRRHHLLGLLHGRSGGDLMSRRGVDSHEVATGCRAAYMDLAAPRATIRYCLVVNRFLIVLRLVVTAAIALRGHVDRPFHEVVPAEDLLGPQLEGEQEVEVSTVREGQLALAEADEALYRLIVVVDVRVGDERVDAVHLHGRSPG